MFHEEMMAVTLWQASTWIYLVIKFLSFSCPAVATHLSFFDFVVLSSIDDQHNKRIKGLVASLSPESSAYPGTLLLYGAEKLGF